MMNDDDDGSIGGFVQRTVLFAGLLFSLIRSWRSLCIDDGKEKVWILYREPKQQDNVRANSNSIYLASRL